MGGGVPAIRPVLCYVTSTVTHILEVPIIVTPSFIFLPTFGCENCCDIQWYPHHLFSYPLLAGMKSLLLWKTDNTNAQQSISRPSDSGTWGHITTCLSPFNLSIHHTNGTQRSSQLRQHRSSLNSTKYPQKIPPQHSSWQPWFPTHLTRLLRTHRMDSSREHGQLYTHPSY